jgi:hypothetical protein
VSSGGVTVGHRRQGQRVGVVVVPASWMIDEGAPPPRTRSALELLELAREGRVVQEPDPP